LIHWYKYISGYQGHLFQNTGTFNSATPPLNIRNLETAALLPPLPERIWTL